MGKRKRGEVNGEEKRRKIEREEREEAHRSTHSATKSQDIPTLPSPYSSSSSSHETLTPKCADETEKTKAEEAPQREKQFSAEGAGIPIQCVEDDNKAVTVRVTAHGHIRQYVCVGLHAMAKEVVWEREKETGEDVVTFFHQGTCQQLSITGTGRALQKAGWQQCLSFASSFSRIFLSYDDDFLLTFLQSPLRKSSKEK
jgi:hypothetical protein